MEITFIHTFQYKTIWNLTNLKLNNVVMLRKFYVREIGKSSYNAIYTFDGFSALKSNLGKASSKVTQLSTTLLPLYSEKKSNYVAILTQILTVNYNYRKFCFILRSTSGRSHAVLSFFLL